MRGTMGEPDSLEFVDIRETGLTAVFRYGNVQCVLVWVDLPEIARYQMEFAFYSPERRVTLSFPSPFLRSMPSMLIIEDGERNSPYSSRTELVTSYRESFKEELIHFHECVTTGRTPVTSGRDSLHDIALCQALIAVHQNRTRLDRPSELAESVARRQPS
jgi:predicted dehydrogenase